MIIQITRQACDGFRDTRTFKTIKGARKFAVKYVGDRPEMGGDYAVSRDGIATIRVHGVTLRELFEGETKVSNTAEYEVQRESDGDDWFVYVVYVGEYRLKAFGTAFEAADFIGECKQFDAYCEAGGQ